MHISVRLIAIACIVLSVVAFAIVLWGGGLLAAVQALLEFIGLASARKPIIETPLGMGILLVYIAGGVVGTLTFSRPRPMAIAMMALGLIAALFGGPVALVYGVALFLLGLYLTATAIYLDSRDTARIRSDRR